MTHRKSLAFGTWLLGTTLAFAAMAQTAPDPANAPAAHTEATEAAPAPAPQMPESAGTGSEQSQIPAEIAALAPSIVDVQIVGPWTNGESSGVWRTMTMTDRIDGENRLRFFVQQVQENENELSVVSTTEVTEISQIDGTMVGYRPDEPAEGQESGLTLFFDIVPSDGEISQTYELFFFPDAPYVFGPATN